MLYPIATLLDETEITASKIEREIPVKSVRVYVEKWDKDEDDFIFFEIRLPQGKILQKHKYPESELVRLSSHLLHLSDDIISYVEEKEIEIEI